MQLNKGVDWNQRFLDKHGFAGFLRLPMAVDLALPADLEESIK